MDNITSGPSQDQRRTNAETRLDNRRFLAEQLESLAAGSREDKDALIAGLKELGMVDSDGNTGVEDQDALAIIERIQSTIAELRESDPVVPSIRRTQERVQDLMSALNETSVHGPIESPFYPEESAEARLLTYLEWRFDNLPESDRTYGGEVLTWEQVIAEIPNMRIFLEGVSSLSEADVYWINEDGELVVGDGCSVPVDVDKGYWYGEAEYLAGQVIGRSLISLEEYRRINRDGRFDLDENKLAYIARSEDYPNGALAAFYTEPEVGGIWYNSLKDGSLYDNSDGEPGLRRVVRTKLKFES